MVFFNAETSVTPTVDSSSSDVNEQKPECAGYCFNGSPLAHVQEQGEEKC